MRHSPTLAELTENLVPFSVHPVASSLIWCTPDVHDEETLRNNCSYLIDPNSSAPARIFHAERYGGSGIQRNGGGARCGFDGRYQIKGIGANPLVGEGSDWRHTNGALGASHAIYEALWSEILAQSLPYGAVRTRAVLLTDQYLDIAYERPGGLCQRALLVRDPVVRPAHFERAPYFRPQSEYTTQLMHDAQRVRAVIQLLPASLPSPAAGFSDEAYRDPQLYCIEGLCELALRQASQMAFCRTRFIRLTTSPSNIAMDGRLLDFNGLSCLFPSDYHYDFGYELRLTELMKEPAVLQQGLSDLCLYLGKYLFNQTFTLLAQQQVSACFQKSFKEACCRGYLELLGVPVNVIAAKDIPQKLEQLVISVLKLFEGWRGAGYCTHNTEQTESPLERVAVTLIRRSQGQSSSKISDLENSTHFEETLRIFAEATDWITDACRVEKVEVSTVLNRMEQQARQRLQPRKCLDRVQMLEEITDLLDTYSDNHLQLRQSLLVMEAKAVAFAKEVFGPFYPMQEGYEKA